MQMLWSHSDHDKNNDFLYDLQITGTGHGIGKELALRYASLGATVVCWDLNQQGNEETINEIKEMGSSTAYAYKYVRVLYLL